MSQEREKEQGGEPAGNWAWNPSPPSEVRRVDPTQLPPEELQRLMSGGGKGRVAGPRPRA